MSSKWYVMSNKWHHFIVLCSLNDNPSKWPFSIAWGAASLRFDFSSLIRNYDCDFRWFELLFRHSLLFTFLFLSRKKAFCESLPWTITEGNFWVHFSDSDYIFVTDTTMQIFTIWLPFPEFLERHKSYSKLNGLPSSCSLISSQAMARVWRDGQKKRCFVYRFISTGFVDDLHIITFGLFILFLELLKKRFYNAKHIKKRWAAASLMRKRFDFGFVDVIICPPC